MSDEQPGQDTKQSHAPQDAQQAREDVELLDGYADLVKDQVRVSEHERRDAIRAGDVEAAVRASAESSRWIRILVLIAAAIILIGSVFIFNAKDASSEAGQSETPTSAETPTDGEDAPADVAPAQFVGTIISDNSWFAITVAADGSASGTLNVLLEMDDGTASQQGTFAGSIDEDDVITCSGGFTGISTDQEGNEFPHAGSVVITAVPTSDDYSTWDITADGEPGEPVTVPAHAG